MRVKKHPEIRSGELLDCAQRLFFAHGYNHTTINDIIREAGVSKGAFYHYFPSKEALLEAFAARLARESLEEIRPLLDDPTLDAVGRLNTLFAGSRRLKVELAPQLRTVFDVIFRPENIVLFHRIDQAVTRIVVPLLADVLREGTEEGLFDAPDPEAFAEMLLLFRLSLSSVMHEALIRSREGNIEQAVKMLDDRLRLYGTAIDRILKLPEGTIEVTETSFVRALLDDSQ
ncbi:TetR/AcrR family transcriptional regulator (plasmid) [Rhizobium sp. CC1099]|uniref:TetR/AcrR family transcriptional regulator n=1 Tax=unclassified Rhizobium TaxID=2613769 RepID=UPI00188E0590|nr:MULTISPECIES: TetR/AcrR family transcriptional regulator [unclassified Rhizobium]QPB23130.1 TetR/AcrR family transcriptional regulator [Rhizobium sp. 007]WFU89754.1 TetR/AcrR family transcriptional regulator [Rhizobium sp. CC1099]